MPIRRIHFDQGNNTARSVMDLPEGYLVQTTGLYYAPGDPETLRKIGGKTTYGTLVANQVTRGLFMLAFDSAVDYLVGLCNGILKRAFAVSQTGWGNLRTGLTNNGTVRLSAAHARDRWFICYGADQNLVIQSNSTLLKTNLSAISGNGVAPIAILTNSAHSLSTGDRVTVTGVTGNTAANGTWFVTVPGTTIAALSDTVALPTATINVASTVGFPASGTLSVTTSGGVQTVTYTGGGGVGTQFTGCSGGAGTMSTGGAVSGPRNFSLDGSTGNGTAAFSGATSYQMGVRNMGMCAPQVAPIASVLAGGMVGTARPTAITQGTIPFVNPANAIDSAGTATFASGTQTTVTANEASMIALTFGASTTAGRRLYVDWSIAGPQQSPGDGRVDRSPGSGGTTNLGATVTANIDYTFDSGTTFTTLAQQFQVTKTTGQIITSQIAIPDSVDSSSVRVKARLAYVSGNGTPVTLRLYDVRIQIGSTHAIFTTATGLYYAVTEYDSYNDIESAPSKETPLVTLTAQNSVLISFPPVTNTGASHWRIYRTTDGGQVPAGLTRIGQTPVLPKLTTLAAASDTLVLPQATITVIATAGFASSGTIYVTTSKGVQAVAYTGTTATTFTGCTGGTGTMAGSATPGTGGRVEGLSWIDTFEVYDKDTPGEEPLALVGVSVAGGTLYLARDKDPPVFSHLNYFRGSLVGISPGTPRTLYYSVSGREESWPEIYVIESFPMPEHDKLVATVTVGDTLLIAAQDLMMAIDRLPRYIDGRYVADDVRILRGQPGLVAQDAISSYSVSGEPRAAWVSRFGIHETNGTVTRRISNNIDWLTLLGATGGLSSAILHYDKRIACLVMAYDAGSTGTNNRYILIHMSPEHVDREGQPKWTGPHYGRYTAIASGVTGGSYYRWITDGAASGIHGGIAYIDNVLDPSPVGTDASFAASELVPGSFTGNVLPVEILTGRLFWPGEREWSIYKGRIRHGNFSGSGETGLVTITAGRDHNGTLGTTLSVAKSLSVQGERGSEFYAGVGGEWITMDVQYTGSQGGGYFRDCDIEALVLGGVGSVF